MPPQAIGALPAVPSAGAGLGARATSQFFGDLSNLPQAMQQQQLQTQQTQEQEAMIGQQQIQRLTQVGISNPQVSASPQYKAMFEKAAKMANLPVAYTPQGTIDVAAMYPKREMTEQEKAFYLSMNPEERQQALAGEPGLLVTPGFMNIARQASTAELDVVQRGLQTQIAKLADPAGGGIQGLISWAQINAPDLKKISGGQNVADLIRNDPAFMQAAQHAADLQTQRLVELGIVKPQAEIAYRDKYLNYMQTKLTDDMQNKAADRAVRQQNADTRSTEVAGKIAQWHSSNSIALRRLDDTERQFDQTMRWKQQGVSGSGALLLRQSQALNSAAAQAQTALSSLQRTAATYAATGEVPQQLQDEIGALQTRVKDLQAKADAGQALAQGATAAAVKTASGATNVQVDAGGPTRTGRTASAPGKPTLYEYSDGSWKQ